MKRSFEEYKKALSNAGESTDYFTGEFFDLFKKYREEVCLTGETQNQELYKIFKSDFYKKNSCAYCVFLELYNEDLTKYRIDLLGGRPFYEVQRRFYYNAENEDAARKWASKWGFKYYEVNKVA